jgi:hypothetical protein
MTWGPRPELGHAIRGQPFACSRNSHEERLRCGVRSGEARGGAPAPARSEVALGGLYCQLMQHCRSMQHCRVAPPLGVIGR